MSEIDKKIKEMLEGREQRTKDAVWASICLAHSHKAHTMKRAGPLLMNEVRKAVYDAKVAEAAP